MTKHKIKGKLVVLQKMPQEVRQLLSDELFDLCNQIFGNITRQEFQHYIADSGAERTYLMLYKNEEEQLVGFFALHIFRKILKRKKSIVFRAQTGLLYEYRRSKANMYFSLFIILKYRLLHPLTPIYCFLVVLSPSMYAVLAKNLCQVYPKVNKRIEVKIRSIIDSLKLAFEFDSAESNEWVTHVGWVSKSNEEEESYWKSSKNKHVNFYLNNNPNFNQGNALITLIPFSWKNILFSGAKVLRYIAKKALK